MKNKKLIIAIVAIVAVLAVMAGIWCATRPETSADVKEFTLTVVHADGSTKEFALESSEEYLAPALVAEGILTTDGVETGMYLIVDGETASWDADQAYWGFYVDGDYATEGMNTTPIVSGAAYKLKYTIAQ